MSDKITSNASLRPLIIIPARLQSARLPNKPLADIAGKPMIQHMVERANLANAGRVVVATDAKEIADVVEQAGGEVVMTRSDHTSGSDRVWEAAENIDPSGEHDVIINLQGDMPTFDPSILEAVLRPLLYSPSPIKGEARRGANMESAHASPPPSLPPEGGGAFSIATLAAPIEQEYEKTDPAVVKPIISWLDDTIGRALYFTRATAPWGEGELYHHLGIYAYRREALKRFVELPPSPLERRERLEQLRAIEAGMSIGIAKVDIAPVGVDTEETLEQARNWFKEKGKTA